MSSLSGMMQGSAGKCRRITSVGRIIKTEEIYQVKTHLNTAFRCVFSWKYFNLDISIHHKASLK
jgi:hypothetical protein